MILFERPFGITSLDWMRTSAIAPLTVDWTHLDLFGETNPFQPEVYRTIPGVVENDVNFVQRIEEILPLDSSMVVLDFGAGTGLVTFELLPKVGKVYLLDPSKRSLDQFQSDVEKTSFKNFEICNGVIDDFKFPALDIVVCSVSLHHVPDLVDALKKIFQVLKPGGRLFIIENEMIKFDELRRHLQEIGFTNIEWENHGVTKLKKPDGTIGTMEILFFSTIRPLE
jgi:SAM-dependent methyltransferase